MRGGGGGGRGADTSLRILYIRVVFVWKRLVSRVFHFKLFNTSVDLTSYEEPVMRVVKGGLDHFSRKIKRSFHNSRKIKWAFHASRKKGERFSLNKSYVPLHFEKLRPKESLSICGHFPSTSRSARCKKGTRVVLHITNGTIFLHCKIIRVVVGGLRSRHRIRKANHLLGPLM